VPWDLMVVGFGVFVYCVPMDHGPWWIFDFRCLMPVVTGHWKTLRTPPLLLLLGELETVTRGKGISLSPLYRYLYQLPFSLTPHSAQGTHAITSASIIDCLTN
jgi:hypothetical protein